MLSPKGGDDVELTVAARPRNEQKALRRRAVKGFVGVLAVVVAQWLAAFAYVLSLLLPFVLAGGMVWAARTRRWWGLLFISLCSPLSLWFAVGFAAYDDANTQMMGVGLQPSRDSFIHPYTRLPIATSGCIVDGNEWVRDLPYNAALMLRTALAGPPPGTYRGPIPKEEEAREALETADLLDWRDLARDRVTVEGRSVRLQRWLGPALLDACFHFDPLNEKVDEARDPHGLVRASIWMHQVLLIAFRDPIFADDLSHIAVVDVASGRLMGHFPGSSSSGSFPLAWRPVAPRVLDMNYVGDPPSPFD
jgi:hypothetical protein